MSMQTLTRDVDAAAVAAAIAAVAGNSDAYSLATKMEAKRDEEVMALWWIT